MTWSDGGLSDRRVAGACPTPRSGVRASGAVGVRPTTPPAWCWKRRALLRAGRGCGAVCRRVAGGRSAIRALVNATSPAAATSWSRPTAWKCAGARALTTAEVQPPLRAPPLGCQSRTARPGHPPAPTPDGSRLAEKQRRPAWPGPASRPTSTPTWPGSPSAWPPSTPRSPRPSRPMRLCAARATWLQSIPGIGPTASGHPASRTTPF